MGIPELTEMGGKKGTERGPVCPLSCCEHLPGSPQAHLKLGGNSNALDPPLAPPALLNLHPKPRAMCAPHWGRGYPQTYLAVPASPHIVALQCCAW